MTLTCLNHPDFSWKKKNMITFPHTLKFRESCSKRVKRGSENFPRIFLFSHTTTQTLSETKKKVFIPSSFTHKASFSWKRNSFIKNPSFSLSCALRWRACVCALDKYKCKQFFFSCSALYICRP